MWSVAGYQANAATLAAPSRSQVDRYFGRGDVPAETASAPYRIAEAVGAVLQRDVNAVARLGVLAQDRVPRLGRALTEALARGEAEQADLSVLAAYSLTGRAARSLSAFWSSGNPSAGRSAVDDLRKAASILLDASVVDTWTLVDSLAHAVEDILATSPWLLLRRASTRGRSWERYLKALYVSGRRPLPARSDRRSGQRWRRVLSTWPHEI